MQKLQLCGSEWVMAPKRLPISSWKKKPPCGARGPMGGLWLQADPGRNLAESLTGLASESISTTVLAPVQWIPAGLQPGSLSFDERLLKATISTAHGSRFSMGNHLQEVKFSATFPEQSLTLLRPGRLSPHSETSLGTTAEESNCHQKYE